MAVKKVTEPKSRGGGLLVERKLHGGKFIAKTNLKDHLTSKHRGRRVKSSHAADALEVIHLTEAESARIDEICAKKTVVSDSILAAINSPWKRSAV